MVFIAALVILDACAAFTAYAYSRLFYFKLYTYIPMHQRVVVFVACFLGFLLLVPPQSLAQHEQEPDAAAFTDALTLYDEGQFEAAIAAFSHYLELDKGERLRREALYYTALSRAALEPARTELFYDAFVTDYPTSQKAVQLFADLGHRARSAGEPERANHFYERALELPPDAELGPRLRYWNAEVYTKRGMIAEAHENYEALTEDFPDSRFAPKALYSRGRLYLDVQEYDDAALMFEQLQADYRRAPVTGRVGTALGEAYYRQGRYEEAISSLRGALARLDSEQEAKAALIMAESYNYLEDLSNATTWYRRYIQLVDGEDERLARYGLGWVFHKQGVYHWAADSFGEAVTARDELSEKALYYEAINRKLSGRYDLALETFERFAEMFDSGEWAEKAYFEWAVILYEIGDHVSAIDRLLHVVRNISPLEFPGEVYTLLGEAYFANAEYSRAIAAFEQAEASGRVTPEVQLQAQFQRAWVLFQNRAYDEAQPVFERVYTQGRDTEIGREALFWSAESFFNQREYTAAADRFRRFVNDAQARAIDEQLTAAARYSLGWSYFMMGEFESAIPPLKDFLDNFAEPEIAMFPYDVDAQLRLADAHFALRRYSEAIDFYNTAADFPQSADYATYQIASSYYRADQTFRAVRTFRNLVEEFPDSEFGEQSQYSIGYIYLLSENYAQAIEEFETTIQRFPRSRWAARAQFNIGNAHFNAQEYEAAIEAYEKVLENYPRSDLIIEAINGIQFSQQAAGMEDTSTQRLEEFLAENPRAGTADELRFRQAEGLLETGDFERAIEAFEQYIRITNNKRQVAEARLLIARAYRGRGQTEQAVAAYQEVVNRFPEREQATRALLDMGEIYMDNQEYGEALSAYRQLSERRAGSSIRFTAFMGMSKAALALGRSQEAGQHLDEAAAVAGSSSQNADRLALGRANVSFQQGNYADASDTYRSLADTNTGEVGAEAQFMLGRSLQEQGNPLDALQVFSNMRIFFGAYTEWVAEAMLAAMDSHLTLNDPQAAEDVKARIREVYPDSEYLRRAAEKLN